MAIFALSVAIHYKCEDLFVKLMVIIKSHFYIRLYQIMMMILQEWDEIPLRVGVSRKVEMLQVVLMVEGGGGEY